ncbi:MAG: HNH endonuclease [Caryophanon sp.]|nr:HNH endonuclease [Caryophanon sp.]
MLKNFGKAAGEAIAKASSNVGDFIGDQLEMRGNEKTGQWMREATKGVGQASGNSVELLSTLAEGAYKTTRGSIEKDEWMRDDGLDDVKDTAKTVGKSILSLVQGVTTSAYETTAGIATQDYDRMRAGLWKGSQIAVVAVAAVGVVDFIDGGNTVYAESINDSFEGDVHPETSVPFERTEIQYAGETISGVYPVFESDFNAQLAPSEYELSDSAHEKIANAQLYEAIQHDASLQDEFYLTDAEVVSLLNNDTPAGYTWHHHEQPGHLQLVDAQTHNDTAHTGGRFIWGGGSEAR